MEGADIYECGDDREILRGAHKDPAGRCRDQRHSAQEKQERQESDLNLQMMTEQMCKIGYRSSGVARIFAVSTVARTIAGINCGFCLTTDLPALAGAAVAVPLVNVASICAALISHVEALAAVDVDDLRALHAPALGSAAVPRKLLYVGVVRPAGHRHVEHHAAVPIADGKFVAS